jgi:hypothetical protein
METQVTTKYQAAGKETIVGSGGNCTAAVTAAQISAAAVPVYGGSARLNRVLVTTTTTSAQPITFYDNATAGSGTIVGVIPGGTTAGTVVDFGMPCINGITIGSNASLGAGGITISFTC